MEIEKMRTTQSAFTTAVYILHFSAGGTVMKFILTSRKHGTHFLQKQASQQ